jgi:hypothetical protein
VAGLSLVDPAFPLYLLDRRLPQAEITLNLLPTLRLHPQLSAAAHFNGLVDYHKTAFDPPGCKIIEHDQESVALASLPLSKCIHLGHGQ